MNNKADNTKRQSKRDFLLGWFRDLRLLHWTISKEAVTMRPERRRHSFHEKRVTPTPYRKRSKTNGFLPSSRPQPHSTPAPSMIPSRSAPNLQRGGGGGGRGDVDSPPPAPPVRDSSTLKSIKYGPGHEKFPSWPVPAAAETPPALRGPPGGGSHRSKSWTDHTNYPKEKVVAYTRPYMKRGHQVYMQQQKLKTVMERCEKIPSETFESRYGSDRFLLSSSHVKKADYMLPSPPERDTVVNTKPQLTQADLEEYARSYQDPVLLDYDDFMTPKHQKQMSYAQSEGYHSYVSSIDSTATPFLDRLRRDSEAVVVNNSRWDEPEAEHRGRDSVVTTSSGSASSSETLKWHGSMSDVSVSSSHNTSRQLIAHSARVKTPQKLHSESVLLDWRERESRNNSNNRHQKYSYLAPDKKHKIPDPTLKAIQKKALLSFYERHQKPTNNTWRSEPHLQQQASVQTPPRVKAPLPSRRASSASDYASNTSKRSSLASTREAKTTESIKVRHGYSGSLGGTQSNSCGSLSTDLLGPIIVGPSISLDDWVPPQPPARPPKNPYLRTAFPDLFRVPSPDLPPPSPPPVLEDEVFHSDEPLPPPPPDCDVTWQQQAEPQVENKKCLKVKVERSKLPQQVVFSGNVAVSQKVPMDQYRAEPLRGIKETPPPLQPRQARVNQSMRLRGVKEGRMRESRSHSMSQSKASYLASRRDRDRIVADSEIGVYKRTMSPNGHTIDPHPPPHPPETSPQKSWNTQKELLKNTTNILRRSSINENNNKEEKIVLPDVLPLNAKILNDEEEKSPPESPKRNKESPPLLSTYTKPVEPAESPPKEEPPQVVEGLQLIQRTEVVLRVNTCTTDAASQTETPMPSRKKLQEEIECERLSEELATHLSTSDRLKELLVPGPEHKTAGDYVQGLFKVEVISRPRPVNSPFRSKNTTPSNSPPPIIASTSPMSSFFNNTSNPLSGSSTYFTISEPKAKFLTRFSQDMSQCHIKDTKDLNIKKEELVSRLDRKLEVLRSEQLVVSEECKLNDELGENVTAHIRRLARPHEVDKFRLHIEEVGKITSLLLGLSGRLARAENALMGMQEEHPEKRILENKRDKLRDQLEEAKKLKECIDKRSVSVSNILYKYLNSEEYTDYDHFINMKAKLIMDSKEIADKIKLGEEQLSALKETLID